MNELVENMEMTEIVSEQMILGKQSVETCEPAGVFSGHHVGSPGVQEGEKGKGKGTQADWGDPSSGGSSGSSSGGSSGGGVTPPKEVPLSQEAPEVADYIVVGDEKLCGYKDWNYNDEENLNGMEPQQDGTYQKVYTNVAPGEYKLSVAIKGDDKKSWGDDGFADTCYFKVTEACDVTVTIDPKASAVRVEGQFVESEDFEISDRIEETSATEAAETTEATETTETTEAAETVTTVETSLAAVEEPVETDGGQGGGVWMFAALALLIALILAVAAMVIGNKKKEQKRKEEERKQRAREKKLREELADAKAAAAAPVQAAAPAQEPIERTELRDTVPAAAVVGAAAAAPIAVKQPAVGIRSAVFQGLGARKDQQDSYGMTDPALYGQQGVMAIVADGMGGLANGKAVSSALVNTFLGGFRGVMNYDKPQDQLMDLTITANQRINQMLAGAERSGSTLLAVIVREGRLHFLTVGDSRIYLYRSGALLQLNREHIYQEELAVKAVNRQVHMNQVTEDRQAHSLTSFIGIGNLPHMDRNYEGIRLVEGDRIMLCSDGVFGTLTQEQMEYALSAEDVKESARLMRDMIVDTNKPYQDNNTGLILEYLG